MLIPFFILSNKDELSLLSARVTSVKFTLGVSLSDRDQTHRSDRSRDLGPIKISTGHIGKQDSFTSSDESVVKGSSWECGDKGDIVKCSS